MPDTDPLLICCDQVLRDSPEGLHHWALDRMPDLMSTACFNIREQVC